MRPSTLNDFDPDRAIASSIFHGLSPLMVNARFAAPDSKSSLTALDASTLVETCTWKRWPSSRSAFQSTRTGEPTTAPSVGYGAPGAAIGVSAASASARPPLATSVFQAAAVP